MPRTIVVLGGALAGPIAAARAREHDEHARILLVERNTHVSYGTTALAYRLSGEIADTADLDREGPAELARRYAIEIRIGTRTVAIDPAAREVTLENDVGAERIRYDALVYALGAATIVPDVPGLVGPNVRPLRTMQDIGALVEALSSGAKRVAVIGGGTIGLEAVDGLVRAGAEVTLVERSALLPRFGAGVRAAVTRELATKVRLELGTEVTGATSDGSKVTSLGLANGGRVDVDFVVLASGVRPRTELLASAGVTLRDDGSIAIDTAARTAADGIFACGSCVAVPMQGLGTTWSAQAAIVDKTAQVAGANAAGASARFAPFVGSLVTRVLSLTVARTGASRDEAVALLGEARVGRVVLDARSEDAALARPAPLHLELLWDRDTGKVLGLEACGRGADRRVDVASVAIASGVDVDALAMLDLAYSPIYGSARDPLNAIAGIASATRAGLGRFTTELAGRLVLDVGEVRSRPDATHVPLGSLRDRVGSLDPGRGVTLVADRGRDAWLAQRILLQRSFVDVAVLADVASPEGAG